MAETIILSNNQKTKAVLYLAAFFAITFAAGFAYLSPSKPTAILLAVVLYAVSYTSVSAGLAAMLFLLPLAKATTVTGVANATIPELALFSVLFSWSIGKTKRDNVELGNMSVTLLLCGFLAVGALSIAFSPIKITSIFSHIPGNPTYAAAAANPALQTAISLREILHIFEWIIAYIIAAELTRSPRDMRMHAAAIASGAVFWAAASLLGYLTGLPDVGIKKFIPDIPFGMLFQSPTSAGVYLLTATPLLISLTVLARNRQAKILGIIGLNVLLISAFFSYSRSVWMFYPAATLGTCVMLSRLRLLRLDKRIVIVALFLMLGPALLMHQIADHLGGYSKLKQLHTIKGFMALPDQLKTGGDYYKATRMEMWPIGLIIFKSNPGGIGLGGYPLAIGEYADKNLRINTELYGPSYAYNNAHNHFLQTLVETGFAGLLLFTLMFSKVARDSLRAIKETPKQENKALAYVLALGVLTVMIYSTFDHPLLVPSLAILFWFEAGALSRKIG